MFRIFTCVFFPPWMTWWSVDDYTTIILPCIQHRLCSEHLAENKKNINAWMLWIFCSLLWKLHQKVEHWWWSSLWIELFGRFLIYEIMLCGWATRLNRMTNELALNGTWVQKNFWFMAFQFLRKLKMVDRGGCGAVCQSNRWNFAFWIHDTPVVPVCVLHVTP